LDRVSCESTGVRTPFLPLLSSMLLVSLFAGPAVAQTADEVVEKHLTALGGREALARLTSRRATGTMTLTVQGMDLGGTIVIENKGANLSRGVLQIDLTALGVQDKVTVQQVFDGKAAWSLNSMQGDTPITGDQLQNMRNNPFPTPLLNYKSAGMVLEVQPGEAINGKQMVVLKATPKAGPVMRVYFDPDTYLVARTVFKLTTPETGEVEQVSEPSDYRTVDGVKVAFLVVNTNPMQGLRIKLDKVEHNIPIDDAIFTVK